MYNIISSNFKRGVNSMILYAEELSHADYN